jgi:hypothetical protein
MPRHHAAILALPFVFASLAHAEEPDLCRTVAHHLWSDVATAKLQDQTPLKQLTAASQIGFQVGGKDLAKPGQSIADALIQDHAAEPPLAAKLRDLPPQNAMQFGDTDIWLLDRVDGSLGCHTAMTVVVPPQGAAPGAAPGAAQGAAHEIAMPGSPDPSALCALSALTAVSIDGTPALWIEQSGAFSNAMAQSTISITGLRGPAFAPPCTVTVDYAVTDRATHAFCDGVDCVPLIRIAEILAMRLRQEETADSLGAGVLRNDQDAADYRRMAEIMTEDKQPAELPTFGASLDTAYTTFADALIFPLQLEDGHVYLARLGHGAMGWRQTGDTLLALYRLRDDKPAPVASVYVSALRTAIAGVTIQ